MSIKVGQVVKYATPENGEENLTFTAMEINGDRCFVQLISDLYTIKPITLGLTADFITVSK